MPVTWTLHSRIPAVMAAVDRGAERAEEGTREYIVQRARDTVAVLTGELQESIGIEGEDVVVTALHGLFNEYGTRYMAPQPFFEQAVLEGEQAFASLMGAVFQGL